MSGIWDRDEAAKTKPGTGNANYVNGEGQYLARIEVCKTGKNYKKIDFACVVLTILADLTQDGSSKHKVGEEVTVLVRRDNDYFMRDWITFIQQITGEDMTNATGDQKVEALEMVFGSDNPLGGTLVEMHSLLRLKKDGNPDDPKQYYTLINWKREVRAYEAIGMLSQGVIDRYFPEGALEALAKAHESEDAIEA